MTSQQNIPPEPRSIRLFGFEKGSGENDLLWIDPKKFSPYDHLGKFTNWKLTKRSFTREEVIGYSWLYIRNRGRSIIFRCLPNKSVEGEDLFDPKIQVQGSWVLIDADVGKVLRINFQDNDHNELDIYANCESLIHSGIRIKGLQKGSQTHMYFKFIQLQKQQK